MFFASTDSIRQEEVALAGSPLEISGAARRRGAHVLLFDGRGHPDSWIHGPLIALDPRIELVLPGRAHAARMRPALEGLERLWASRRRAGGTAETGVVALVSYDLWGDLPALIVWSVDESLRSLEDGRLLWTSRSPGRARPPSLDAPGEFDRACDPGARPATGRPRSSLPREAYLDAVSGIRHLIAEGEVYQANLCQQFRVDYAGDPFEIQRALGRDHGAPHSAFLESAEFALVSASPETFVRMRVPGIIETWPIKGTRPRSTRPDADRAAARALEQSPKDRAELMMIVDLERNDLSRVCRAGTVAVRELGALRSFATVHHLVAGIEGRLRDGVGVAEIIEATFPGGSITGAPKIRAMEILRRFEPWPRGFFTGSLFWLGDDGRLDSSILIRSLVFRGGQALLGAGGGIVADSDPEAEWAESNHKARFLARVLGFEPEEAS